MKTCRFCNEQVTLPHYCYIAERTIEEDNESDFISSAVIGAVTDSALLGGLIGGDIIGGIVGDLADGDLSD